MKRRYIKPETNVLLVHTRYAMLDDFSVSKKTGDLVEPPADNDWGAKRNNVWQWDDEDDW